MKKPLFNWTVVGILFAVLLLLSIVSDPIFRYSFTNNPAAFCGQVLGVFLSSMLLYLTGKGIKWLYNKMFK